MRTGELVGDLNFVNAVVPVHFVLSVRAGKFIEAPPGGGLQLGNRLGRRATWGDGYAAGFAGDFLEQLNARLGDARLGVGLQSGCAGSPSVVAAQDMLLGRRDVAFGTVGEIKGDGGAERANGFLFQAGERVDFVGNPREADVADANGLQTCLLYTSPSPRDRG